MTNAAIPASFIDATTSRRMSRQRTRDTQPEFFLRRELHQRGLRYRVDSPLPEMPRRRADVLFTRAKVAVLVDGCFWHGCPEHKTAPNRQRGLVVGQARAHIERDRETSARLTPSDGQCFASGSTGTWNTPPPT